MVLLVLVIVGVGCVAGGFLLITSGYRQRHRMPAELRRGAGDARIAFGILLIALLAAALVVYGLVVISDRTIY